MSVANAILRRDSVRLISDTMVYRGGSPVRLERKIIACECAPVAFIARGPTAVGDILESFAREWGSYDEAIGKIIAILSQISDVVTSKHYAEVTIGGYDDRARLCRVLAMHGDGGWAVSRFDHTDGVFLAPTLGDQRLPADMTDEQAVRVAFLQQEIAVKHKLNLCIGGDVEIATITAEGTKIRTVAAYPNKATTLRELARRRRETDSEAA